MSNDLQTIIDFAKRERLKSSILKFTKESSFVLCLLAFTFALFHLSFFFFPWTIFVYILDLAILLSFTGLVYRFSVLFLINKPSLVQTARQLEQKGIIKHPLLAISLELASRTDHQSPELVSDIYKKAISSLNSFTIKAFKLPPFKRSSVFAFSLALALFSTTLSPHLYSYWSLPFSFVSKNSGTVLPGTIAIARNSTITLQLHPVSKDIPSCKLSLSYLNDATKQNHLLRPNSSGNFSFKIDSLSNSIAYHFSSGGHGFTPETVTVVPPPLIKSLQVILSPPSYTKAPPETLREGEGSFAGYTGTRVKILAESGPLRKSWLLYNNDSIPMKIENNKAKGEFTLVKQGSYTFSFVDTFNQHNDSLPQFHTGILEDEPPLVQFLKPGANKSLTPAMVETLWVEATDDFGIRSLQIKFCKNGEWTDSPEMWDISDLSTPRIIRKQLIWKLKELSLYPGDTLFYWAQGRDLKPDSHIFTTDTFWFRVPSFEEIQKAILAREENAKDAIGSVQKGQEKIDNKLEKLTKSVTGQKELTWDQKQILNDVKEQMKAQGDSLSKAVEALKENIEKMKQSGNTSQTILDKMEQVKKALEDLVKQYGDSTLFNKMDNKPDISLADMKQAVEKLNEMLPELSERLDNTLKYLEMLKKDRETAEMASRANQLSKEQAELAQSKQNQKSLEQQKDLLDRIKNLSKDVSKQKNDSDKSHEEKKTQKQIDSLSNSMSSPLSKQKMPSSESMNQMSGSLSSLSHELESQLSSNQAKQMEKQRQQMLAMTNDIFTIAQWQKQIADKYTTAPSQEQAKLAKEQQALKEALQKSRAQVDSLSSLPPNMSHSVKKSYEEALGTSDNALGSIGQGDAPMQMGQNGTSLNSLANTILDALSQMEGGQGSGGGQGGMMPGLKKLSGKQAAINSATSDLLRSLMNGQNGQGENSGDQGSSEQARKDAEAAQKSLADELKKLSEKYGKDNGGAMQQKIEELEKEAQRLAQMLQHPDRDLAEHQDRFLAKMLQTTLSLHKENEGKEDRKSRTSENIFTDKEIAPPGSLKLDADTFNRIRRKAFDGNYPEQYRSSVRAYFDSLGVLYLRDEVGGE